LQKKLGRLPGKNIRENGPKHSKYKRRGPHRQRRFFLRGFDIISTATVGSDGGIALFP
jgi:hypothetical protein